MPPLPTTYDDETKTLIASIQRRQKDLTEFQIPRLRSCKGPLSVQQNFAAELREDIDALGKQIEVATAFCISQTEYPYDVIGSRCVCGRPKGRAEQKGIEDVR